MTLSQLKPILSDYADWLTEWKVVGKDGLVRVAGPVAQGLWLDRLRTGSYRPTFYVRNLCVPKGKGTMELPQYLPGRFETIHPSRHSMLWPEIIQTAHQVIYPDIHERLDPQHFFRSYQEHAVPTPPEAVSIAAFAALLGERPMYEKWKKQFYELLNTRYRSSKAQFVGEYSAFLGNLELGQSGEFNFELLNETIEVQQNVVRNAV